jgi:NAD+ kinase
MVVFVEQTVMDDTLLINNPGFSVVKEKLMTFRDGKDDLTDKIDFIICLGGDGTLLYASLLFQVRNSCFLQYHFVCYISYMDFPGIEPGPLWREAGV